MCEANGCKASDILSMSFDNQARAVRPLWEHLPVQKPLNSTTLSSPLLDCPVNDERVSHGISKIDPPILEEVNMPRYTASFPNFRDGGEDQDDEVTSEINFLEELETEAPEDSGVTRTFDMVDPSHCIDGSRFWAVLIGIDDYMSYPLHGCVSDARLMEQYLVQDLSVPKERIQLLLSSSQSSSPGDSIIPSRTNMINTLCSLIDNPQINEGDNIVVYFAGHGSLYDDDVSPTHGSVEALCPMDRDSLDPSGRTIPDISDREINSILTQVSRRKGHRITFILDCSHTGSLTRYSPEAGVRSVPPLPRASLIDMLRAADEKMGHYPNFTSVLAEKWLPDMSSHVVMAACRDFQFAKEVECETGCHGLFTQSLIRTLEWAGLEELTYVDLIYAMPSFSTQTPVVAGKNKDARIWYQD